ncbi:hypothetical protein [Gluconobacter wancherniae]|uniref:hypothetical protein n=1 Tax=Gluconobacter wancherniae TaxID=1307955 RepID=UPI001B8B960C|nr:hypothetical protein [Gluconobacter wancherniae]MBS1088304.1 hypothetical protein [Gluconobacter wancherniae]
MNRYFMIAAFFVFAGGCSHQPADNSRSALLQPVKGVDNDQSSSRQSPNLHKIHGQMSMSAGMGSGGNQLGGISPGLMPGGM